MAEKEANFLSTLLGALAGGVEGYAKNSPKLNPELFLAMQDAEMKKEENARAAQLFTKKMAETDASLRLLNLQALDMADPIGVARRNAEAETVKNKAELEAVMAMLTQAQQQGYDLSGFSIGGMDFKSKKEQLQVRGNLSDRQFFMSVLRNPDATPYEKTRATRFLENADKIESQAANQTGNYNELLMKQYADQQIEYERRKTKLLETLPLYDEKKNPEQVANIRSMIAELDSGIARLERKQQEIIGGIDPEIANALKDPELVKLIKELIASGKK